MVDIGEVKQKISEFMLITGLDSSSLFTAGLKVANEWTLHIAPVLDENDRKVLRNLAFVESCSGRALSEISEKIEGQPVNMQCIAVDTADGKLYDKRISTLQFYFSDAYDSILDFVRAKRILVTVKDMVDLKDNLNKALEVKA